MSYSTCTNCKGMVPAYEKYCQTCLNRHPQLKQVPDYWRSGAAEREANRHARDDAEGLLPDA